MSETTKAVPPTESGVVSMYVAAVRRELADLAPDEVEDLTGGMEADLGELLSERGGTLESALGVPAVYAADLRQAAGLPERQRTSGPQILDRAWFAGRGVAAHAYLGRHPWLAAVWRFIVTLRPAWWVLRGLVAAYVVVHALGLAYAPTIWPTSPGMLVIGLPSVVLSVLLGRWSARQWGHHAVPRPDRRGADLLPGVRFLLVLANAFAVPAAILAVQAVPPAQYVQMDAGAVQAPEGLSLNGAGVGNVFVYDAQGHRLTAVRLFGSDGASLVLGRTTDIDGQVTLPGVEDVYGQWWTNVYPRPYTLAADPWAVSPLADPASPRYDGSAQWTPPPSIAPLRPDATASLTSTPPTTAASTASVPASSATPAASTAAPTTAPTTASTTASTTTPTG